MVFQHIRQRLLLICQNHAEMVTISKDGIVILIWKNKAK